MSRATRNEFLQQPVNVPVPLLGQEQKIMLRHFAHDGHTAYPIIASEIMTLGKNQEGVTIKALSSFGGLTKLEALAGMIAGHIAIAPAYLLRERELAGEKINPIDAQGVAAKSVDIAQAILAECKRRQTPEATA